VQRVSNTKPIPQNNIDLILHTALAGEFSGKKLIYLEAGSGAVVPADAIIIESLKANLMIPLIVGGGIRTKQQLNIAFESGADLVVIGTTFENDESFFENLKKQ
jgi:geranylgeranylglyceryl phosphate synthase family protein